MCLLSLYFVDLYYVSGWAGSARRWEEIFEVRGGEGRQLI